MGQISSDGQHSSCSLLAADAQSDQLMSQVYDELRRRAQALMNDESPGHTLSATSLVHEAYVKLHNIEQFKNKDHYIRLAARAMRQILVDHARSKSCQKRGGDKRRVDLTHAALVGVDYNENLIALDEALSRLAVDDSLKAEIVQLRFFVGLTIEEAAHVLRASPSFVKEEWAFTRAWLKSELSDADIEFG